MNPKTLVIDINLISVTYDRYIFQVFVGTCILHLDDACTKWCTKTFFLFSVSEKRKIFLIDKYYFF